MIVTVAVHAGAGRGGGAAAADDDTVADAAVLASDVTAVSYQDRCCSVVVENISLQHKLCILR